jgi:hypothetical protein
MISQIQTIKKNIIRKIAQTFADVLIKKMEIEIDLEDKTQFWFFYEQAAKLNAYCIVFHDIYLD